MMNAKLLLSVLMAFFLLGFNVSAQISPGDLSKAHAHLEGVSNCTQCHSVGNKVTREKCLACHKEIKANIIAKRGYHASVDVNGKECKVCHNEHHGRNFQFIKFDKNTFDHRKAGFELKGAHSKQDCKACHKADFIKDPKLKKKISTFLGLNKQCLNCHSDYHQGKMSANCMECHSFESFKNAKAFDHRTTRFPLIGRHKNLDCKQCHKTEVVNGKSTQGFSGLVFNNCNACHKDVHQNKFGQNCKQCHTEESFHTIKSISNFDHDKTDFKLIGRHKGVNCKSCHKINLTSPVKHDRCSDCHTDYHKKEFAKNGVSPDCNQCHDNSGFTQSSFSIEKHNLTKFKLEDAHIATPCISCHKKQESWTFRNIGSRCVDCHKNEHKGFIQDKVFPGEDCTVCHNVNTWKSVKFDHNLTDFKLDGAHTALSCVACHYSKNAQGVAVQHFSGLSKACSSCHKDSHDGQFAVNGKTDCTLCHGTDDWTKNKFDHNTSKFKLEGAHAAVRCEECHKVTITEKGKFVKYKFDSIECSSCHQ
jgi:hypothetical protein